LCLKYYKFSKLSASLTAKLFCKRSSKEPTASETEYSEMGGVALNYLEEPHRKGNKHRKAKANSYGLHDQFKQDMHITFWLDHAQVMNTF